MKGDFARDTFDSTRHFSRVLMQQGRVQVEADWNEQTSILLHYLHTLARDLLGPHAGPSEALGFGIAWRDSGIDLATIEPDAARRAQIKQRLDAGDLLIGAGRYYVDGILVENEGYRLCSEQPGYPFASGVTVEQLLNNSWLAYLDVWERHICAAEDDRIREVALGGPDTATRARVVWQVKTLLRPDGMNTFNCGSLDALLARQLPILRARAMQAKPPTELCLIAPEARYRGAENQLYRVEVHRSGMATDNAATTATFKWSRENGSVVFPIQVLNDTIATLEHLGPDLCLGLKPGDWVEAVDDELALAELPGAMAQVMKVDRDLRQVTLKWASPVVPSYTESTSVALHAMLRRWDHKGNDNLGGALQIKERSNDDAGMADGWVELEDGVQIWFGKIDASYRSGDYWLIPARVVTGDIEWPRQTGTDGKVVMDALEPHGPRHAYAPLFYTSPGATATEPRSGYDCRCEIAPLPCMGND